MRRGEGGAIVEPEEHPLCARYRDLLAGYLEGGESQVMPALKLLSGEFIRCQIGPEEVAAFHERALKELLPTLPEERVAPASLQAAAFLRLALRGFGVDPLRPYLETSVTSRFVGQILRELEAEFHLPDVARIRIGSKYAENFEGDLANYLDMFRLQGLGNLTLKSVDEAHGELLFTGRDVFESYEASDYPQDHFTRGFLARAVSVLTRRQMNCEEVACQAQGAPECRFVVTPVAPGPIPNLRRLLDG
ncbi:MAG TPA: phosphatase RsbU N-terminal domain-containing protein [Armatimonadota bacterium]|nr:hypothetical protein [Armatimonadota bacterium]HOQ29068.1 phosphatase RsbU N-terminal domain-containing protein [Armatimonadota bacterium]HPO71154.1 phosphatase RsbU N-terminal domain-containing protein [Armatimonadota bacterium]HPT97222.1 phosphatase RsbU N-terminal domain-containing protein [Armatimonadota bacterium]